MAVELTVEILEQVLDRIAGGESLRAICREPKMPQIQQLMRLRLSSEEFAEQYARAREMQAEQFYDEILEIVDDGTNDFVEREDAKGNVKVMPDMELVQRSKMRYEARRWAMSKILPKRFGEKLDVEHTGKDGGPLVFTLKRVDQE